MAGGFKPAQDADADVQTILDGVREDLAARLQGVDVSTVTALSYSTQVVAGVIYLIKARCGADNGPIVHVKIIKPLPHTNQPPSIMNVVSEGISLESDLNPI